MRFQDETLDDYFARKLGRELPPDECWEWKGARHSFGYGKAQRNGRSVGAHRLAYSHFVGPIPEGQQVCHRCDNPPCCNPAHLFVGTQADNLEDMRGKGRADIPRGERHWNTRLTREEASQIKTLCEQGWVQKDIAEAFGVDPATVSNVKRGVTWADV